MKFGCIPRMFQAGLIRMGLVDLCDCRSRGSVAGICRHGGCLKWSCAAAAIRGMRLAQVKAYLATIFYLLGSIFLVALLLGKVPARQNEVSAVTQVQSIDALAERVTTELGVTLKQVLRPKDYPKRKNMEQCAHPYGRVTVFVGYRNSSLQAHYKVAQQTLDCYIKGTDYKLLHVDLYEDPRVKANCGKHKDIMFLRHCALLQYLNETDWMLVLDADTGVVNPEHCIEEWIDDRVSVILYERFMNWEITAGIFLVKNSPFGHEFMRRWAEWEFHAPPINSFTSDNCVLHMHVLETVFHDTYPVAIDQCDVIWRNTTGYETYLRFVFCTKIMLGANRFWPGKLKIYPRAQGIARDSFVSGEKFDDSDFFFHGWKSNEIGAGGWKSPFERVPDLEKCRVGSMDGWYYRENQKWDTEKMRAHLARLSVQWTINLKNVSKTLPWTMVNELETCYPNCMIV